MVFGKYGESTQDLIGNGLHWFHASAKVKYVSGQKIGCSWWGTIWRRSRPAWNTGTSFERDEQMASGVVTHSQLRRLTKPVLSHISNPYPLHRMRTMAQEHARRNWHLPSRSTPPVTARGRVSYTRYLETWMAIHMAGAALSQHVYYVKKSHRCLTETVHHAHLFLLKLSANTWTVAVWRVSTKEWGAKRRRTVTAQVCVRFVVDKVAVGPIFMSTPVALSASFNLRSILIHLSSTP